MSVFALGSPDETHNRGVTGSTMKKMRAVPTREATEIDIS